jgi:hypothetical protein
MVTFGLMDGPIDEMTHTDHREKGNFSKNHPNSGPSQIDRGKFAKQRQTHWNKEWNKGRWGNKD